ncbi:Hypothetical protein GbCGDNIH6_0352 [Granulibacter bethesdensis]|nr:Hypothetical protein GbCGDNIH6_0352 [Granulibacter bethesdensis]
MHGTISGTRSVSRQEGGMTSRIQWLTPGRIRIALAWLVFGGALGVTGWQGMHWQRALRDTHLMKQLRYRNDVTIPANAAPEVYVARGHYLLEMGKYEDARSVLEHMQHAPPHLRAMLSYDIANTMMRRAIDEIDNDALEKSIPLVISAKQDYRRALKDDPLNWDMKYNLDVAMRMVRDFPAAEQEEGDSLPATKKLWPNMPGQPQGLP